MLANDWNKPFQKKVLAFSFIAVCIVYTIHCCVSLLFFSILARHRQRVSMGMCENTNTFSHALILVRASATHHVNAFIFYYIWYIVICDAAAAAAASYSLLGCLSSFPHTVLCRAFLLLLLLSLQYADNEFVYETKSENTPEGKIPSVAFVSVCMCMLCCRTHVFVVDWRDSVCFLSQWGGKTRNGWQKKALTQFVSFDSGVHCCCCVWLYYYTLKILSVLSLSSRCK